MNQGIIKFTFIVVCMLLVLMTRRYAVSKRDWLFLTLAMGATLAADFFLLIVRAYPVGVTVFWFAHVFHTLRFSGKRALLFFPLALPVPIVFLIVTGNALVAISMVYMGLFIMSIAAMIFAVKNKKYPPPNNILIVTGMILFVLCDIHVALFNLGNMGAINNHALTEYAVDAIWLFYAPAQICLAFSAMQFNKAVTPYSLD